MSLKSHHYSIFNSRPHLLTALRLAVVALLMAGYNTTMYAQVIAKNSNDSVVMKRDSVSRKDRLKNISRLSAALKKSRARQQEQARLDSIELAAERMAADREKLNEQLTVVTADSIARLRKENDSLYSADMRRVMEMDSLARALALDSVANEMNSLARAENASQGILPSAQLPEEKPRDWSSWRPDPQKALWMALVIPGGGQIYNRKYWKLPIIYGGIVGCVYAMTWNNMMYKDYSQAYLDIMDSDPNTQSYNKFLHLGMTIDGSNEERYKQIFKSRKDKYRRWRDLSFFCLIGVYAISVIDAYVDAELSQFDISDDLSMRVQPAVVGATPQNSFTGDSSLGINCTLNF